MPHLRRQPNPHDHHANQGPDGLGSLRAQFQTPPARHTPSNPTYRHPPSTGPNGLTPEPAAVMAPPASLRNPFAIFGRDRDQNRPETPAPLPEEERVEEFFEDFAEDPQEMEDAAAEEEEQQEDSDDESSVWIDPDEEEARRALESGEIHESEFEESEDDEDYEDVDVDEEMHDREKSSSPLPPNLREISSLASWTVSTSKPGCGVSALRNPSPMQYWQSDGPQPHTLTLHFFKLVAVVRIRVYLDFELDESYTPTKMVFLAGMGGNDLVEFATWEGDGPCGWVDVPLTGVGGRNGGWVREDEMTHNRRSMSAQQRSQDGPTRQGPVNEKNIDRQGQSVKTPNDIYNGNVLKAMVIQMRVMENHQNGKDTHVRGFQVFACDDSRRRMAVAPSASADGRPGQADASRPSSQGTDAARTSVMAAYGLEQPDWMGEPVIR
ncbi:hypothetical protein N7532_007974 [Penicillium argentinense]|uniref:DOC domain-containing protein n=1 Tax=Penicillium argentinense TaxID=1131581 RepID=A0A9W9EWS0_9EURO|nr:uncharacterized protein N7532_007974 [Penicillium argentinense]KAJ5089290.1 hypothetical protein N7532_007974 [Penicillium argentinense]